MKRAGKSRWALPALCVTAAIVVAGAPSTVFGQGPGEYDLQLPTGDDGGGESEAAPTPAAPVVPVAPTVTTDPTLIAPEKKRRKPKPPEPVFGTTSLNATLGAQRVPPLRVRGDGGGVPMLPIGLAALAAACCLLAAWRLRVLRELPRSPVAAAGAPLSVAAKRVRSVRPRTSRTSGSPSLS